MQIFNLEAFLISFGLIFLAELGDKTQLMVITLAAKKGKPFIIGSGSSIGISLVAVIGIILGLFFSIFVPSFWIKIAGGIIFIFFGIYTLIQFVRKYRKNNSSNEELEQIEKIEKKNTGDFFLSLINVFIMEFGDKTQIMTITLAASYYAPLEVGLGAILSLSSLCFMGAYLGGFISKKLPKKWINLGAGIFFIIMGILLFIEAVLTL